MPNPNSMPDPKPSTSKEIAAQPVPALLQPPLKQPETRREAVRRVIKPRKVNQAKSKNPLPAKRRKKTTITTEDSDESQTEEEVPTFQGRRGRPPQGTRTREQEPLHRSQAPTKSATITKEDAPSMWTTAAGAQVALATTPNPTFMIKALMPQFNKDAPKTWFIRLKGSW